MKLVDDIIHLRRERLIKREWNRKDIKENLEELGREHAPNTITTVPSNFSISREGDGIGNSVKDKGATPVFWRVSRGLFQLIEDPADDLETQRKHKELAKSRVEELKGTKERTVTIHSPIASTSQPSSVARPRPESIYSGLVANALTEVEREKMEDLSTEQKALNIVREFLKDRFGGDVEIEEDGDGVDLRVTADGRTERILVKGTAGSTMEWEKLKVSSPKSHDALVRGDALIYRVVDVHGADPIVYMLIHGEDFTLEPEPRWAVKQVPPDNERYPLLGKPYRYDRPNDPVALEDWEILK